ncbi:hypothetical protein H4219_005417 [Mycoemilia scoparia]|uniref:Zn(2)-C6 fungal-type domain-containing protein n=1 Tax=Mycoemilia scoparia TaxID=417184 RepID=A0A9W8DL48_9FUNG|nr:hypothetical protein H4219_005417 [Mycoemilia scoparia]
MSDTLDSYQDASSTKEPNSADNYPDPSWFILDDLNREGSDFERSSLPPIVNISNYDNSDSNAESSFHGGSTSAAATNQKLGGADDPSLSRQDPLRSYSGPVPSMTPPIFDPSMWDSILGVNDSVPDTKQRSSNDGRLKSISEVTPSDSNGSTPAPINSINDGGSTNPTPIAFNASPPAFVASNNPGAVPSSITNPTTTAIPTTTVITSTSGTSTTSANNRVNQACATCRRKKVRCDGGQPSCQNCVNRRIPCTYLAMKKRGRPRKSQPRKDELDGANNAMGNPNSLSAGNGSSVHGYLPNDHQGGVGGGYHSRHYGFRHPSVSGIDGMGGTASLSDPNMVHYPGNNRALLHRDQSGRFFPYYQPHYNQQYHHGYQYSHNHSPHHQNFLSQQQQQQQSPYYSQPTSAHPYQSMPTISVPSSQNITITSTPFAYSQTQAVPSSVSSSIYGSSSTEAPSNYPNTGTTMRAYEHQLSPPVSYPQQRQQYAPHPTVGSMGSGQAGHIYAIADSGSGSASSNISGMNDYGVTGSNSGQAAHQHHHGFVATNTPHPFSPTWEFGSATPSEGAAVHSSQATVGARVGMDQVRSGDGTISPDYFSTFHPTTVTPRAVASGQSSQHPFILDVHSIGGGKDIGSDSKTLSNEVMLGSAADYISSSKAVYSSPAGLPQTKSKGFFSNTNNEDNTIFLQVHPRLIIHPDTVSAAMQSVTKYFSQVHPHYPTIHKATFMHQLANGTLNQFVWFSLRACMAHDTSSAFGPTVSSDTSSRQHITIGSEFFIGLASECLQAELSSPGICTIQGLILLSLSTFKDQKFQKSSIYWCQATRIALQLGYHLLDAPSKYQGAQTDVGWLHWNLQDINVNGSALGQGLFMEIQRRLWWTLFVGERFYSITEHLQTLINDRDIHVRLPCPMEVWDQPVFPNAHEKLPPISASVDLTKIMTNLVSHSETKSNPYLVPMLCYGHLMGEVAALHPVISSFIPQSAIPKEDGADSIDASATNQNLIDWRQKLHSLQLIVQNIECKLEAARVKFLELLRLHKCSSACVCEGFVDIQRMKLPTPSNFIGSGDSSDVSAQCGLSVYYFSLLVLIVSLRIHTYSQIFHLKHELTQRLSSQPGSTQQQQNQQIHLNPAFLQVLDLYTAELWQRCIRTADYISCLIHGEDPSIPRPFAENALLPKEPPGLQTSQFSKQTVSSIENLAEMISLQVNVNNNSRNSNNGVTTSKAMSPQPYFSNNRQLIDPTASSSTNTQSNNQQSSSSITTYDHHNSQKIAIPGSSPRKLAFHHSLPHSLQLCVRIYINQLRMYQHSSSSVSGDTHDEAKSQLLRHDEEDEKHDR